MAIFYYNAKNLAGKIQTGTVYAGNQAAAVANLTEKGLTPILIRESKGEGAQANLVARFMPFLNRVKLQDKVVFSRQLATMINAGVPIAQSLNILGEQAESKRLKTAVQDLAKQVEGGSTLANALAQYPDIFSNVYINMVKAGETGGILDDVLDRLATQQEKDAEIVGKVRSAMIYPAVITVATISAFFFLMIVIVPKLATIFAESSVSLPIYTRILLGLSDFLVHQWYIVIGGTILAIVALVRWHKTASGKRAIDRLIIKAPIFGPIVVKVNVARFARTFGSLMASGISVLDALAATKSALGNSVFSDEVGEIAQKVKNGRALSEQIRNSKNFPAIVGHMLAVGEETGKLDEILLKLAGFYEREVDTVIGGITSIIEPLLIIVLGAMVGFIVISVFGPISALTNTV